MSDPSYDPSVAPDEPPNIRQMREHIKKLESDLKESTTKAARAEELERQISLRDAGLSLDALQLKALGAVHEGEWTPDSIRDTAVKLGFTPPAAPEPSALPPQELATMQRMAQASLGAPPGAPPSLNPYADRDNRIRDAQRRGASDMEIDAIFREYGTVMTR